ncbi:MAG: molybdate ABC transporter substrate-binding protein [Acetobacteraceae bacterium]|nr:molybdate ABC transporter substrate-binding protein [Acetobacteraceae bacterium]
MIGRTYRRSFPMRRFVRLVLVAVLLVPAVARADALTVLAAASLTEALGEVASAWSKGGHPTPRLSFASSSTLARQIEQGAPANVFASADEQWMDYLDTRHLLAAGTRRDLLSNQLVLVVPAGHPEHVQIGPGFDLLALLGPKGRLAMGDPAHVPAGLYGREALTKLGLWDKVADRIAPANDVRSALLLVERGEAPAGIVYATDAAATKGVAVAGVFPADSHAPITYPFAIIAGQDTPDARDFLQFASGAEARAIFAGRGFTPVE